MERQELINRVKTRIDEVSAAGDVIIDVGVENTKPYDSIIDELLDESALEVLLKAPIYRLPVYTTTPTCAFTLDPLVGEIIVPDDFLRLVSFQFEEWQQPVINLAMEGDEIAQRQANKYLRGGVAKPIGVLKKTSAGLRIVYYSRSPEVVWVTDTDADGKEYQKLVHSSPTFNYIKKDTAESIDDAQMTDAMVWICAGKTLGVLNQVSLQNLCFENAKGLLI